MLLRAQGEGRGRLRSTRTARSSQSALEEGGDGRNSTQIQQERDVPPGRAIRCRSGRGGVGHDRAVRGWERGRHGRAAWSRQSGARLEEEGRGGGQVDTSRRGRGSAGLVVVCGGRDQVKCIADSR
jgi:hypothetical protein